MRRLLSPSRLLSRLNKLETEAAEAESRLVMICDWSGEEPRPADDFDSSMPVVYASPGESLASIGTRVPGKFKGFSIRYPCKEPSSR